MPIDPAIYEDLTTGAKIIIILIIVGLPVLGTITVVLIQSLASKVKQIDAKADTIQKQSKRTIDQVENDHESNLRDDLDEKVSGLDSKLNRLVELGSQQILAMNQADRAQADRINAVVERINDLSTRVRRIETSRGHQ